MGAAQAQAAASTVEGDASATTPTGLPATNRACRCASKTVSLTPIARPSLGDIKEERRQQRRKEREQRRETKLKAKAAKKEEKAARRAEREQQQEEQLRKIDEKRKAREIRHQQTEMAMAEIRRLLENAHQEPDYDQKYHDAVAKLKEVEAAEHADDDGDSDLEHLADSDSSLSSSSSSSEASETTSSESEPEPEPEPEPKPEPDPQPEVEVEPPEISAVESPDASASPPTVPPLLTSHSQYFVTMANSSRNLLDNNDEVKRAVKTWRCAVCKFPNPTDRVIRACRMCNSERSSDDASELMARSDTQKESENKHKLRERAASISVHSLPGVTELTDAPGRLHVKLLQGHHIFDFEEFGEVFCRITVDKQFRQVSELANVTLEQPVAEWNQMLKPFQLDSLRDQYLYVHLYENDEDEEEEVYGSNLLGFGELKLDHGMLHLTDESTKHVEVPLKFKDEDGVVHRLRTGADRKQAYISFYLSYESEKSLAQKAKEKAARLQKKISKTFRARNSLYRAGTVFTRHDEEAENLEVIEDLHDTDIAGSNQVLLKVKLHHCKGLANISHGDIFTVGTSPYVAFSLKQVPKSLLPYKEQVFRSRVVHGEQDPEWNQEIGPFFVTDLVTEHLTIEVHDAYLQSHSLIGRQEFSLSASELGDLADGLPRQMLLALHQGDGVIMITVQLTMGTFDPDLESQQARIFQEEAQERMAKLKKLQASAAESTISSAVPRTATNVNAANRSTTVNARGAATAPNWKRIESGTFTPKTAPLYAGWEDDGQEESVEDQYEQM